MPRWLLQSVVNIPDVQHDITSAFRECDVIFYFSGKYLKGEGGFRIFHWTNKKLRNVLLCKITQYFTRELFCLCEIVELGFGNVIGNRCFHKIAGIKLLLVPPPRKSVLPRCSVL